MSRRSFATPPRLHPAQTRSATGLRFIGDVAELEPSVLLHTDATDSGVLVSEKWLARDLVGRIPEVPMRASELLGRPVVDPDGVEIGQIWDIRCGESRSAIRSTSSLSIASLVVGPNSFGRRLGYTYGDVHGPWLLTRLLGWLGRHDRIVPLNRIADLGPPVTLSVSADQLAHPRHPSSGSGT